MSKRLLGPFLFGALVSQVHGQALVSLSIDGPMAVIENQTAQYRATAHFDDGSEFEVTLSCDWTVKPEDYASINALARLSTMEVPADQDVRVAASFTWENITRDDSKDVTIVDVPPKEGIDPWPFWGRNARREGYTSTFGPRTPTFAWSVLIGDYPFPTILWASPVMDSHGRLAVGDQHGVAVVDSTARELLWTFTGGDIPRGVAVWGNAVLWGDVAPFSKLYCFDAKTGEELWTLPAPIGFNDSAPVVDSSGVVYIANAFATMYARRVEDGSEVWTATIGNDEVLSAASLFEPILLATGGGGFGSDMVALDPGSGDELWRFETDREVYGAPVVLEDRLIFASTDRYLYSVDRETGQENWRFWTEQYNNGCVAIAPDGTVYTATTGNIGLLFAVSPEGEQLWRRELPGLVWNAPIVAGNGLIYVTSTHWNGQLYEYRVHAVRTDGTELWSAPAPIRRL